MSENTKKHQPYFMAIPWLALIVTVTLTGNTEIAAQQTFLQTDASPDVTHYEIFYPAQERSFQGPLAGSAHIAPISVNSLLNNGRPYQHGLHGLHGFQSPAAGKVFHGRPAAFSVNLFAPNTVQQPAETPGQMENYRKALEEIAQEEQANLENNRLTSHQQLYTDIRQEIAGGPRSYVNVEVDGGDRKFNYNYAI